MATLIATTTPRIATRKVCIVCQEPANDDQGLILELVGYIHPLCSNNHYELVTAVSVPDEDPEPEPEPDPTCPASAAVVLGFDLCADCQGLTLPFGPGELCPACQEAANVWESDHAPDYDLLYERFRAAKDYLLIA